jgi:hypothetical protein
MALVEPGVSIICGCLAILRPLGEKWFPCLATGPVALGRGYEEMPDNPERNGSDSSEGLQSLGGSSGDEDAKEWKDVKV